MTDRATKGEQLAFLKNEFKDVAALVLTSVQGLNAAEVDSLRRKLHDAGVNYRVVKNTLAKKATIAKFENPSTFLKGAEPVGDDQDRHILTQPLDGIHHPSLRIVIQSTGRLIKNNKVSLLV